MLSRKYFGIAGAAMMGTVALVGTNAANAQINLDTDTGGIIYAKETLETKVTDSTAYVLNTVSGIDGAVMAMSGVAGGVDNVLYVTFNLGNDLVFAGKTLDKSSLTITQADDSSKNAANKIALISGGAVGDDEAIFTATVLADYTDKSPVQLKTEGFSLPPDGSGSITMTVVNQTLLAVLPNRSRNSEDMSGAVKVMKALNETPMSGDATAVVAKEFKEFKAVIGGGTTATMARLGSFTVEAKEYFNAATGAKLQNVGAIAKLTGDSSSTMTITGDFSFADEVTVSKDCSATADKKINLLLTETVDGVTRNKDTLRAVSPPKDTRYLCIKVSGDEKIKVGSYNAVTKYVSSIEDSAFVPEGSEFSLGSIKRDGTTVQLPYLTTDDRFNQRIYIVNRGSDTTYVLTFNGAGDEKGMDAEGSLPGGGMRTILSLHDDDVVTTPSSRSSTSGTLVIVAEPAMIDVATNQINRALGTSDTVVYSADD